MSFKSLIAWSKAEFSHLPWRLNRSLYRTLVSEIMLQQTTVTTVKNHFERFLVRFPDLESLASASEEELLVAWKGLGYYRRARNLKKIAEVLAEDYEGEFPHDMEHLMAIPGIGPYTANALIGIGMDKRALAVDANLERVIARLFGIQSEKGLKLQKEIQILFNKREIFKEKLSFRALNEALMDLGRTYCQARRASCELCPLKQECVSSKNGNALLFPVSKSIEKKKGLQHELHLLRVFILKKDKILVYKKQEDQWLSGQYEVPTYVLSTTDKKFTQYPKLAKDFSEKIHFSFATGITKYKIQNSVLVLSEKEFIKMKFEMPCTWRTYQDEKANLSTATIKGLSKLLKE